MDIAKRSLKNPLLRPADLKAGINRMEITCLLNPGVFRMNGKTWLLLRVAERPKQTEGKISFPIYNDGKIEVLSFDVIRVLFFIKAKIILQHYPICVWCVAMMIFISTKTLLILLFTARVIWKLLASKIAA